MAIRTTAWNGIFLLGIVVACSSNDNGGGSNDGLGPGGAGGTYGVTGGAGPGMGGAPAPATCGNGRLDPGEQCDGAVVPTCAVATMNAAPVGNTACLPGCQLDVRGCTSASGAGGTTSTGGFNTGNTGNVLGTGGLGDGGTLGGGGAPLGSGGAVVGAGGTPPAAGGTGAGGVSTGSDLDALRQVCLDAINQYRATLSLPALTLAAASVETCSDQGAQADAAAGVAHGSAGKCPGMNAQDTCPGWPTAQYGGEAAALTQCLKQMWAEGEPPEGRAQCLQEYFSGNTACFLAHGHYLNMSDSGSKVVACGFYRMSGGKLWMNQDFGR